MFFNQGHARFTNSGSEGALSYYRNVPFASGSRSGVTITTGADQNLTFNTIAYNFGGITFPANGMAVPLAGLYELSANIAQPSVPALMTHLYFGITVNGVGLQRTKVIVATTDEAQTDTQQQYSVLAAGDVVSVSAHAVGANTSAFTVVNLIVRYVGPST